MFHITATQGYIAIVMAVLANPFIAFALRFGADLFGRQVVATPQGHDTAQAIADYNAALEGEVKRAEEILGPNSGAAKVDEVLKGMDAYFAGLGIHGDARKVNLDRVRADLELVRAKLFPSGPQNP